MAGTRHGHRVRIGRVSWRNRVNAWGHDNALRFQAATLALARTQNAANRISRLLSNGCSHPLCHELQLAGLVFYDNRRIELMLQERLAEARREVDEVRKCLTFVGKRPIPAYVRKAKQQQSDHD